MKSTDLMLRILTEQGRGFESGGRRFELAAQSLGGELLIARDIEALGLDTAALNRTPLMELLRVSALKRQETLRVIARATCRSRKEHLDEELIRERESFLAASLDVEEVASLLSAILGDNDLDRLQEDIGLNGDRELQRRLSDLRSDESGMIGFGGRCLFGRVVDAACSRYGWSYRYVVWGISHNALAIMLADQMSCVSISDNERRKLGLPLKGEIDGDSASIDELRALTAEE